MTTTNKPYPILYSDKKYEISCDDSQFIVRYKNGRQNSYFSDLDVLLKKIFNRELKLQMKTVGSLLVMKDHVDACMRTIEEIADSIDRNF